MRGMRTLTLHNRKGRAMSINETGIRFTPIEEAIFSAVDKMIGKKKGEHIIPVEEITAAIVTDLDRTDEAFYWRNKSMIANVRHLAVKTQMAGPFIFVRDAPIKRGRPVTNGMGNKAAYIVTRRKQ